MGSKSIAARFKSFATRSSHARASLEPFREYSCEG